MASEPGETCFLQDIVEAIVSLPLRKQVGVLMMILPVVSLICGLGYMAVTAAVLYGNYVGLITLGVVSYVITTGLLFVD